MKSLYFLVLLVFAQFSGIYAQDPEPQKKPSRLGLGVHAGYNTDIFSSQPLFSNELSTATGTTSVISRELVTGSYGAGFKAGATVRYRIYSNFSARIAFDYLQGSSFTQTTTSTSNLAGSSFTNEAKSVFTGKMMNFIPGFEFNVMDDDSNPDKCFIKPYVLVGFLVGIPGFTEESTNQLSMLNFPLESKNISKYSGGLAWGFTGSIGIRKDLGSKLSINAGVDFSSQRWYPARSEVTESTAMGISVLPMLTPNLIKTEYVDKVENTGATPDLQLPAKAAKFAVPYSVLGFNISVNYRF